MELSVREARAQFATALAAAERGERVTITKNGKPVAELGPPPKRGGLDWDALEKWRRERGFDKLVLPDISDEEWFAEFNDPEYTRLMLGEDDREL